MILNIPLEEKVAGGGVTVSFNILQMLKCNKWLDGPASTQRHGGCVSLSWCQCPASQSLSYSLMNNAEQDISAEEATVL